MEIKVNNGTLCQWDTSRTVQIIPDEGYTLDRVEFSCAHAASPVIVPVDTEGVATVPAEFLQHSGVLTVTAVMTGPDRKPLHRSECFPVSASIRPEGYGSGGGGSASAGSGLFIVNCDLTGKIPTEDTSVSGQFLFEGVTFDKTYAEVVAAVKSGAMVVMDCAGMLDETELHRLPFITYNPFSATFGVYVAGATIAADIGADGSATFSLQSSDF